MNFQSKSLNNNEKLTLEFRIFNRTPKQIIMQESDFTKVFTGGFFEAQLIQGRLEKANISPVVKDKSSLGLQAYLVNEYPKLIEIFVNNDELDIAIPIVEEALAELKA